MSELYDFRARVVSGLKELLPAFRDVEAYSGRFADEQELRRFTMQAPAIRVGVSAVRYVVSNGEGKLVLHAQMIAIVATKPPLAADGVKPVRDRTALETVEAIILAAHRAQFEAEPLSVTGPSDIRAEEIDSGTSDTGIVLWGVSWVSPIIAGPAPEAADPWY